IYSHNRQSFSPSQPAPTTLHILSLHDALPISRGNHRARSRYKTIDNYRYPARCRAQDESGDRSDFKAANLCKYVQGIACIRFVPGQCIANDVRFVAEPIIVDASSPADDFFNRQSGERAAYRRAGRRIPGPHTPGPEKVVALTEVHSCFDGLHRLFNSHRRPFEKVLRTSSYFSRDQAGYFRKVIIHARIDYYVLNSVMPAEHVDGGAATDEVENHLRRDLSGISAYPGPRNTVIGSKGKDCALLKDQVCRSPHQTKTARQFFQTAKTIGGLGEIVEMLL